MFHGLKIYTNVFVARALGSLQCFPAGFKGWVLCIGRVQQRGWMEAKRGEGRDRGGTCPFAKNPADLHADQHNMIFLYLVTTTCSNAVDRLQERRVKLTSADSSLKLLFHQLARINMHTAELNLYTHGTWIVSRYWLNDTCCSDRHTV